MSKTFDIENTSIPSQMSIDVRDICSGVWPDDRTKGLYRTFFESVASFLKFFQSKNEEKVVFKLKDEKGDFKFGAILHYQAPEEDSEEDSGNWYLSFSFDEESIGNDYTKEIDNFSETFYEVISNKAREIMYGAFRSRPLMNKLVCIAIDVLRKYLDNNADELEDVNVVYRGIFTASVVVEGGVKIMSIVPGETVKQIIKSDATL